MGEYPPLQGLSTLTVLLPQKQAAHILPSARDHNSSPEEGWVGDFGPGPCLLGSGNHALEKKVAIEFIYC